MNTRTMPRAFSTFLLWVALFCGLGLGAHAQQTAPTLRGIIKVARVIGEVHVTDTATSLRTRVTTNTLVVDGQVIETAANASVVLVLSNGALVNVKADSRVEVSQFLQNPFKAPFRMSDAASEPSSSTTKLILRQGEIISQVKKLNREAGSSFTVETPVGAAGIRGTAFRLAFRPSGNTARFVLSMAEGLIRFVPVRGRAVEVAGGREINFNAQIDATTGQILNLPNVLVPTDVSGAELAGLQATVADTLATATSIEFAPSTGTSGPFASAATTTGTDAAPDSTDTDTTEIATPDASGPTGSGPLASPPPLPPTQRTTPGDGE